MNIIFKVVGLVIIAGFIAVELGVTASILELLAGIVAGNFLGFESLEIIDLLADFGLLAVMYLAGLEIDADIMRQYTKSSLFIGFFSFFSPFFAIFAVFYYFLSFEIMQALLVGVALSTTSVAIVYSILRDAESLSSRGKQILAAAMVTDVFSMLTLSLLFTRFSVFSVVFIIMFLLFSYFIPFMGKRIFHYYRGNAVEFEFKIILFLILSVEIVSEAIGIESVLFAFILGMVTSGFVVEHEKLLMQLRALTFGFLAPIFFFKVGTTVDLLSVLENLPLLALLTSLAFIFKFSGTYLSARLFLPEISAYISYLFNSRLSLGLVSATIGYEMDLLGQEMYSALVGAVVISTLMAAVFTKKRVLE